jgi:microcystin-dependent protein
MALTVTSPPWQQVNMPALDLRRYLSFGLSEGVGSTADLVTVQRAAGANMSVDIGTGEALVQGDSVAFQGRYYVLNDAVYNLTGFSAAHATLPRIDRVTIRLRDAFHGDAANDVSFQIITGTATSGANLSNLTGAGAIPASQVLLANILIPAASTSITTGNIDSAIRPISTAGGSTGTPPGSLSEYAGASAPPGWLFCDGTAISRTTYATLFGIIGTTYGAGDGSTTFNLPDMRGRMPVGKGTHADIDTLGENDGAALADRRPKHKHTLNITDPGHTHTSNATGSGGSIGGGAGVGSPDMANATINSATTGISGTAGPTAANTPSDAPSYITLNYIIKT